MSIGRKGGVISATPPAVSTSGASGVWALATQLQEQGGSNWPAQPLPPSETPGQLWMWGYNARGQLGINATNARNSPVQVASGGSTWTQIGTNITQFSMARTDDDKLYAWGSNYNGQLGISSIYPYAVTPVQVGALTNWRTLSVGANNSAHAKSDGTLWIWGTNIDGAGTTANSPVQVGSDTDWDSVAGGHTIAAGTNCYLFVKSTGALYGLGVNYTGQLGTGNTTIYSTPVQIGALTDWKSVAMAVDTSLAIKTDGTLWAWGNDARGATGRGGAGNISSPAQVGALTNWADVAISNQKNVVALKTDGTLWAWGRGDYGQLGQGSTATISSPVQVGTNTDWADIGCADNVMHAITTGGTLWGCGYNAQGQLGISNTQNKSSLVQIGSLTTWVRNSRNSDAFSGAIRTA